MSIEEGKRFPAMEDEIKDEVSIRSYLLGYLSESQMQGIEERLLTDPEFSDRVLLVEHALVEEYMEGELKGRARRNFKKLFLATPQGQEQIRFTRDLQNYAPEVDNPDPVAKPPRRLSLLGVPAWAFAAAATIMIAAGIGVWWIWPVWSKLDKGLFALNEAFQQRPVDARITGLKYVPRPNTRSGNREKVDYLKLKQAEIDFSDAMRDDPGPAAFHAFGRYHLTQRNYDLAIDYLRKAMGLEPNSEAIQNDLGAAYLEKGKAARNLESGGGEQELSESLKYLDKAIELNPFFLDALFNRALLLQQKPGRQEALNAWQEYLKHDSRSGWADEARANMKAIEEGR